MGKNFTRIVFLLFFLSLSVTGRLTAQINCETPANLAAANISPTGAVLYFGTTADTGMYNIRYHGPGTTTWTTLNNVTAPFQLGNLTCNTAYEWQAQRVCGVTPNNAPVLSAWSLGAGFTTAACSTPTCPVPANLTSTNISQNGAVLSVGANTTNGMYNIRYHGPNSPNWITVNNVTIPYQLGNLSCGTAYEWQMQQVCGTAAGAANLSAWSAGAAFTTEACPTPTPCPVPANLTASNISQTGAVLHFGTTTDTRRYNIRYHGPNSTTWIVVNNVAVPFQLGNLACNTGYEWQAQQVCANSASSTALSDWSVGAAFTTAACPTPAPCPVPANLTASNISQTGAVLHFGTTTDTRRYNIRYHGPNSTTWIVVNNTTVPFQLGNLTCNTAYEWQAQQICTITGATNYNLSDWSAGAAFTTAACPAPACPVPTYLSTTNISQTGAVLNLGTIANTGTFNIRYRVPNAPNWIVINNVMMPFQLGNLTCHTAYEWQAQKVCANADNSAPIFSEWSVAVTFTTTECPQPTPCPVPANLTASNITQTGAVLHFGTTAQTGRYNIRYHGPNSTTWITVNNVTVPFQLGNLTCHTGYEWQAQQICANAAGATALSDWSVGAAFTTAACAEPTPCAVPTNLTASNITQTGAVLHFGSSTTPGRYNIRYHGPNSATWIMVNNVTVPFQLGNLICHTTYEWQAQQICGTPGTVNNNLSAWSVGAAFTTAACPDTACLAPTNLMATNIGPNGAVLHFGTTATDGRYNIRYHGPNSPNWITVNNVTVPFQLRELMCNTRYEWQAQKICGTTPNGVAALSPWSVGAVFTTAACPAPACPVPTNLSATNISQNGALLHWNGVTGVAAYIVRYRPANSDVPFTTVTSTTNSIQVGNLTIGTVYVWQVSAVCANGTTAAIYWSPESRFMTRSQLLTYPNPGNGTVSVSYSSDKAAPVQVKLMDFYGKEITVQNRNAVEGINVFNVNTSEVSDGLYFIGIYSDDVLTTTKVIIKH